MMGGVFEAVKGRRMAEEPEKTLGQRIRAKREELDWSQEKLAEKIGVSSLSILRWELDRSFPRGDEIQFSLIQVLNLPKDEFSKKRKRNPAQKKEKTLPAQEALDEQEISPVEEVKKREGESTPMEEVKKREKGVPIEMVLPNQYWQVPIPSAEEIGDTGTVKYKIPPVIMYRGFYEQVYHKKFGYAEERRVTSNGKRLLPYDTWVNPETVIYGWGHTGSGPRHLAESLLLDYFEVMYPNEQEKTLRSWVNKYSFNFMMDFTAWFDKREWEVWSGAITAWLQEQRENGDPAPSPSLSDIDDGWTGWWKRWEKYKGT
jgi:transcriptional regulator with XRE-family HTH domain